MKTITGHLHLIVPANRFRLVTGVAQHYFCRICGTRPYYVPRSNPDGFSVNVRCLEPGTIRSMSVKAFDGVNREKGARGLAHLSKPDAR